MNERKLSELQKEYRSFFLDKMCLYGVKSPAELTKDKKSEFFTEMKQDWAKHKLSKKKLKEVYKQKVQPIVEEPEEVYEKTENENKITSPENKWTEENKTQQPKERKQPPSDKKTPRQEEERPREFTKQIIKSEPNVEQTDDL